MHTNLRNVILVNGCDSHSVMHAEICIKTHVLKKMAISMLSPSKIFDIGKKQ